MSARTLPDCWKRRCSDQNAVRAAACHMHRGPYRVCAFGIHYCICAQARCLGQLGVIDINGADSVADRPAGM